MIWLLFCPLSTNSAWEPRIKVALVVLKLKVTLVIFIPRSTPLEIRNPFSISCKILCFRRRFRNPSPKWNPSSGRPRFLRLMGWWLGSGISRNKQIWNVKLEKVYVKVFMYLCLRYKIQLKLTHLFLTISYTHFSWYFPSISKSCLDNRIFVRILFLSTYLNISCIWKTI